MQYAGQGGKSPVSFSLCSGSSLQSFIRQLASRLYLTAEILDMIPMVSPHIGNFLPGLILEACIVCFVNNYDRQVQLVTGLQKSSIL